MIFATDKARGHPVEFDNATTRTHFVPNPMIDSGEFADRLLG
jgi:hypothetical protein